MPTEGTCWEVSLVEPAALVCADGFGVVLMDEAGELYNDCDELGTVWDALDGVAGLEVLDDSGEDGTKRFPALAFAD